MKIRRFLLSFLCLMMAFVLYGEENGHVLSKDTLHYLVKKNKKWYDFKSEISIYSDSEVLKRTCCQLLGIDEKQTLQEYVEKRLNTYDSKVPFSETIYNQHKREGLLGHDYIMICPMGEAVGDYQTFEVNRSYQRIGRKKEYYLYRTFVYDLKNDKVMTVDDFFVPNISKNIKYHASNHYISIHVQKTKISCGISPENGITKFEPRDYIKNEQDFTESFKQAIAFDELKVEGEKQRQQDLREQQRKDRLRNDSLQKEREEYLARTAYKRISNDFGKLTINKQYHTELRLPWAETTQPSRTNLRAGNYVSESFTNTDGTTDSLWVKYMISPQNYGQWFGVNERMSSDHTRIETMTIAPVRTTSVSDKYEYRKILSEKRGYSHSYERGRWTTYFDIDKPANNPDFEQCLCKLILNKSDKRLEDAGEKFVKSFKGIPVGKAKANAIHIRGRSIFYNPGKFYSYAYSYTYLKSSFTSHNIPQSQEIGQAIVKNIIYDIKNQKVLSLSDVLTPEEIAHLGLEKRGMADLALDNYYLYVGIDGKLLCTYALSRENWNKFTGVLQNLIAPYDSLPAKIDSTYIVFDDYEGIQPASISYSIKQEPLFKDHADSLLVYLKSHLALPDTMKRYHSWKIQFVVGKDGKLSHVKTTPEKNGDGDESFAAKLTETFEQMPAWQPLDLVGLNVQNSLLTYNVKFVPHPTLGDDGIYEIVDTDAQFPGGEVACSKWISEHTHYPANCMEQGVQGRVFVTFVVNIDGSISDVKTRRSPDPALSEEAERVIKMMPKWIPAMLDGVPVRTWFKLPVIFSLGDFYR